MSKSGRWKIAGVAILLVLCIGLGIFMTVQMKPQTADRPEAVCDVLAENGNEGVQVEWTSAEGADGYEIWRSENNDDDFIRISTVTGENADSFLDKDADAKTVCFYKVRALAGKGDSVQYGPYSKMAMNTAPAYRIPVFAYHRFCDKMEWDEMGEGAHLFVQKKNFEQQMKWLNDNGYRTINCDEFYRWHEGIIELPEKTVMITMDDGNYSVVKYSLPVLKKYGFKATVFLMGEKVYDVTDTKPYSPESFHAMGIDTVEKVHREYENMEFQSHTYGLHKDKDGQRAVYTKSFDELYEDAVIMKEKYGCDSVAYPFGAYSDDMIKALEKAGYKVGFKYGDDGYATRNDDRFIIPRVKVYGSCTLEKFTGWAEQKTRQ